jgi:hypothetical protein
MKIAATTKHTKRRERRDQRYSDGVFIPTVISYGNRLLGKRYLKTRVWDYAHRQMLRLFA